MAKRAKALLLAFAITLALFTGVSPASAASPSLKEGTDAAAILFDPLSISTIELSHVEGGEPLTFNFLNTTNYQHANIRITLPGKTPVTFYNIGLRLKGQASRGDAKFPLKVKFDAFVPGQSFLGLKRLTLNNMAQDDSFVHEVTAYKLYRSVGVPAPRAGYSKVSVDGNYFGLYLNLESIDKIFGKRWFPSTNHIYSGPYNCDILPGNTCYEVGVGDTDRTDLNNAGNVASLSGAEWWTAINRVADMQRVIKLMAVDIFLSNWDGYTDAVQNNHFVHFDKNGKLTIIPWGLDQTFTTDSSAELTWDASQPIFRNWSNHRSTMLDHCIAYTPCHTELIHEGLTVSNLATSVNIVNYKNSVASVVNLAVSLNPDIHWADPITLQARQSWIDSFIPQRQAALANFLASHAPRELAVTIPTSIRVGASVKATMPQIWEPNVSASFQWQLDGSDIVGQTGQIHAVLLNELGHTLSVAVTLTKASAGQTTVSSNSISVIGRAFKLAPLPKISGTAVRGRTLKVVTGKWDSGTSLSFQWKSNGQDISGATNASYKLTAAEVGHRITVSVTGTKFGYSSTSKTSTRTVKVR